MPRHEAISGKRVKKEVERNATERENDVVDLNLSEGRSREVGK